MTDEELDRSFDDYMAEKGELQPWRKESKQIAGDPFKKTSPSGRVLVAQKRPWGS